MLILDCGFLEGGCGWAVLGVLLDAVSVLDLAMSRLTTCLSLFHHASIPLVGSAPVADAVRLRLPRSDWFSLLVHYGCTWPVWTFLDLCHPANTLHLSGRAIRKSNRRLPELARNL